jgi:hypothetical protein
LPSQHGVLIGGRIVPKSKNSLGNGMRPPKNLRDLELLHRDTHRKMVEPCKLVQRRRRPTTPKQLLQQLLLILLLGNTFAKVYARHICLDD